jgi:hypothetical protein
MWFLIAVLPAVLPQIKQFPRVCAIDFPPDMFGYFCDRHF